MKANTIIAKLILAILSILSLLVCEILSDSVLSREELAACIYWNDFDIDRCIAGYYKCESSGSGCCPCQQGSFMTWFNKCSQCLPFRDCLGNEILFEGNYRNDRVCGDLRSTTVSTPTETTVSLSSSSSPDLAIDLTTEGSIYSIIGLPPHTNLLIHWIASRAKILILPPQTLRVLQTWSCLEIGRDQVLLSQCSPNSQCQQNKQKPTTI
ncbi:uncharacterized protein [Apostichopus japonicus]|uniref:uncharacterized protein isoform X2 n=1 Tax=Stichopus japonicus TaxID=307972 RepID=UPI003AB7C541